MTKNSLLFLLAGGITSFLYSEESCDTTIQGNDTIIICTARFQNGIISDIRRYKNRKREGLNQDWYENGNLKSSAIYNQNCIVDTSKFFHSNGTIEQFVSYKDCKLHGDIFTYDSTGRLIGEEHFNNGRAIGDKKFWYSNGNLREQAIYDSLGEKNGTTGEYFENGKIAWEVQYAHGKALSSIEYFENEQVALEETYTEDGKRIKTGSYFFPDGKSAGTITDGNGAFIKCITEYGCTKIYYENGEEVNREDLP
jgi:antitoxin component YwqK of YwqJK toxin-antitoxin module